MREWSRLPITTSGSPADPPATAVPHKDDQAAEVDETERLGGRELLTSNRLQRSSATPIPVFTVTAVNASNNRMPARQERSWIRFLGTERWPLQVDGEAAITCNEIGEARY
jgi:hypothetical protein